MTDYSQDEYINVVGKTVEDLQPGDIIQPICDLYTYDGAYQDSYKMGNEIEIENSASELTISDTILGEGNSLVTYRFTDMYGANHWTETLKR